MKAELVLSRYPSVSPEPYIKRQTKSFLKSIEMMETGKQRYKMAVVWTNVVIIRFRYN